MDSKGRDVMLDETEVKGAGSLKEGREGRREGSEAGEDLLTYRTNKCLVGLGEALGTPSYILELGQLEFLLSAIKVVRWSTHSVDRFVAWCKTRDGGGSVHLCGQVGVSVSSRWTATTPTRPAAGSLQPVATHAERTRAPSASTILYSVAWQRDASM